MSHRMDAGAFKCRKQTNYPSSWLAETKCYQAPLTQFITKQPINVNNVIVDARNSMLRTQRTIQKLLKISYNIGHQESATMKPAFDNYSRVKVGNKVTSADRQSSQRIIPKVLNNLNILELQNIELGKRILAAKIQLSTSTSKHQKQQQYKEKDKEEKQHEQKHQQQQHQQQQHLQQHHQQQQHQQQQHQQKQMRQDFGYIKTRKDYNDFSNSSGYSSIQSSGGGGSTSGSSSLSNISNASNQDSSIFTKYKGWNFKINDMTEANKLLRPRIALEFALKGGRSLGKVIIQLCTVAAPLIVLEFVRKCMACDARSFKIRRIFPKLWIEHNLIVDSEKVQGPIECDMRCIDHSKIPYVLSFAKNFSDGFPLNAINFTISLKRFEMLNGNRVGFGHVIKGQNIIESMQRYGSASGKTGMELYTKKCYAL